MTNTRLLSLTAALAVASLLSACGGGSGSAIGGGVTTPAPGTPTAPATPDALGAPASYAAADLAAFAVENGAEQYVSEGVAGYSEAFQKKGTTGEVSYATANVRTGGLVTLERDGQATKFLVHTPAGVTDAPVSGSYDGEMAVEYQVPGSDERHQATGQFGFSLYAETGEVFAGGMANGADHSVEIYADAQVRGGEFHGTEVVTVLRDSRSGSLQADNEVGNLDGVLVDFKGGNASYGTVTADNGRGFTVNSGFATVRSPE